MSSVVEFWNQFLETMPNEFRPKSYLAWAFGNTPSMMDRLADLVLNGPKRATTSLAWIYEHFPDEKVPEVGQFSVVLNGSGEPVCIIETTKVETRKFKDVDEVYAHTEGEGDRSLKHWKSSHWDYFTKECQSIGRTAAEDMPVICEIFKLVFPKMDAEWHRAEKPTLETARLTLEPITEAHAEELCALFADPELHQFVPLEPPTLQQQTERCARWAKGRSPDGSEIWLNWAGRNKDTGKIIAHFQSGVKSDGIASIGYVVSRNYQNKGFATEGLEVVFNFLRSVLNVREIKAWSDSRNKASHRLAQKLGMKEIEFIKDADHFKGSSSDEFVFSKHLDKDSSK